MVNPEATSSKTNPIKRCEHRLRGNALLPIDRVFDEHKRGLADHGRVLYAIARFRILAEGVSDYALKQNFTVRRFRPRLEVDVRRLACGAGSVDVRFVARSFLAA